MPSQSIRVVIVGASPDEININAPQRSFVARAFSDLLGSEHVMNITLEYGPEAVSTFGPDLVLVFGSCLPDVCDYGALKRATDHVGAHLAFWLHDDPYEFDCGFKAADVAQTIFSNDRWSVEHYRGGRVFHLPLAACPHEHYKDLTSHPIKKFDLFFAGAAFPNRIRMFRSLEAVLSRYQCCVCGSMWPDDLPMCVNEWIPNSDLSAYFARSLAVLNLGRDFDLANERFRLAATTPGPRTFEAAMAGCVQCYFVTGLEIEDYFEPDKEILLFDDPREIPEIIDSLLSDPERALDIAGASQRRALRDHTYQMRARKILEVCLSYELPPVETLHP
jgi:spore maturation protein CgeB